MATFKTPGVFIEEVSTIPPSVAPVPTSIPGFVGYTQQVILPDGTDISTEPPRPIRITSLLEFEQIFGGPFTESFSVTLNDPQNAPIITVNRTTTTGKDNFILYYQLRMFYANGGGTCYVASAGLYSAVSAVDPGELNAAMNSMEQIDEVTLLVAPEVVFLDSSGGDKATVYNNMLTQCQKMEDRFAILDVVHASNGPVQTDADNFRNNDVGADNLKFAASYYPGLNTTIEYNFSFGENDPPNPPISNSSVEVDDQRTTPSGAAFLNELASDGTNPDTGAYNLILNELATQRLVLYPSAAMAGTYARVDDQRGVWKAPANVGLSLVLEPNVNIDNAEQENLNVDSVSGKSINAIRQFAGRGNLVWGARTLAGNDNEWRYVNVRRLFLFVEESIRKATEFTVFESNTAQTWSRVRGTAESFLTGLWRDGALAGATTEDAFFVRVGLGTTMTSQDILEGKMIVEIGLAAVRPAEFIILRFSHKLQE